MILVLAEKPSVGRDIARVLKCGQKGEGFLQGSGYIVTWAFGHLVTMCDPDELDERYKKWRAEDLPILPDTIPTKVIAKSRQQFNLIKKLMQDQQVERIICATDAGREGELIFGLIYEKAGINKPVDRLWISSMTDAAIKEGFESLQPREKYAGLYQSALCRSQADWLVGMNASRAFTLSYGALLSVGRVQTPTLAILVKRLVEIREFKPEEYYTLSCDFGDYKGLWFDPAVKEDKLASRIADQETAQEKVKRLKGKAGKVTGVVKEEKKDLPPQLFDLTTLQREANRLLGFTADKTLKTAQSLYETKKAITYPRTDSRYLPHDMISRVYKSMESLAEPYAALTAVIDRKDGKLPISRRLFDDAKVSDHHAIIPTPQKTLPDKLAPDEKALFDLIARRFIAAFCPAHSYEATRVTTVAEGESFKTLGKTLREEGWKKVYGQGRNSKDKDEEEALPDLSIGDECDIKSAKAKKESTKPPPPHTDASLLAFMENAGREIDDEALREQMKGSGLGTPATRAGIIERLIQVGYARRQGKALAATEKGEKLINVAPPEITSPETTGKWELALSEIAGNNMDIGRFMQGIRSLTSFLVTYARDEKQPVEFEREVKGRSGKVRPAASTVKDIKCPLCGKPVQETDKAFGCSGWREGCVFTLWKDALSRGGGPKLNTAIVTRLLQEGRVAGSTGTVSLSGETVSFTKTGQDAPSASFGVRYQKKKA